MYHIGDIIVSGPIKNVQGMHRPFPASTVGTSARRLNEDGLDFRRTICALSVHCFARQISPVDLAIEPPFPNRSSSPQRSINQQLYFSLGVLYSGTRALLIGETRGISRSRNSRSCCVVPVEKQSWTSGFRKNNTRLSFDAFLFTSAYRWTILRLPIPSLHFILGLHF